MTFANGQPHEGGTETKERILEAALTVFGEKGYHNATIAEIAEEAGIGKGTVYWYFSSKEELFAGMVDHGIGVLEGKLYTILSNQTLDFPKLLKLFVHTYLEFTYYHRHLARIFLHSVPGMRGGFEEKFFEWRQRFSKVNTELIRRGVNTGFFQRDFVVEWMETALAGLTSAFIGRQIINEHEQEFAGETEFIYRLLVEGIGSKNKGVGQFEQDS